MKNIYFKSKSSKRGEDFKRILKCRNVVIERIVSSKVDPKKVYVQKQDEWVLVLKGKASLDLAGKVLKLGKGDFIFIPAKKRHRVLNVQKGTTWLAIHIY